MKKLKPTKTKKTEEKTTADKAANQIFQEKSISTSGNWLNRIQEAANSVWKVRDQNKSPGKIKWRQRKQAKQRPKENFKNNNVIIKIMK